MSGDDLVGLVIDEAVCIGIGVCVDTEPDAVVLGEDGVSRPAEGVQLPRERAERLCKLCPSGAIAIRGELGA